MNSDSDTAYILPIVGFFVAIIAIVAAYFLAGAVVGIIVTFVVLAIAVRVIYRMLSENTD